MKDTFTVLKKAVAKQKYIAFYFFEFLREQVPEFYVKRTDPNKRTYPISTCTRAQTQILYLSISAEVTPSKVFSSLALKGHISLLCIVKGKSKKSSLHLYVFMARREQL